MCSYAKLGKRIAWLDSLKMFAMFLVVFGHCCSLQSNNLIGIHYLDQWIVSFNMPLFVFVSGLVAYKSLNGLYSWTDCLSYIRKISERIALPNVCFSCFVGFFIHFWGSFEFSLRALFNIVVFSFFFIIVFFQDKSIIRKCYNWIMLLPFVMNIFGIYSYFWFLSMLLFVMGGTAIVIVFVRKIHMNQFWVAGGAFLMMLVCGGEPNHTEEMIPYFLIGYLCAKKKSLKKSTQCHLGLFF